MPTSLPTADLEAAHAAVAHAKKVRDFHRKRSPRDSEQRIMDIELALARLKDVMAPLRSEIGRFSYGPQTEVAEANRQLIREASIAIQTERRKLFKMKKRKTQ